LGQFIDATGSAYGIKESKRFDLQSNVSAMISYLRSCLKQAAVKNSQANEAQIYTLAYGLYHDGPSLNYGGMEVARQNVLPWIDRYASWLDNQPVTGP
ncbi:MAG TPA: hypothetical protein PLP17_13635, partial [Oligoflexia bacterium]|nr:hypothetical protein [Oligoflexia bacterium]